MFWQHIQVRYALNYIIRLFLSYSVFSYQSSKTVFFEILLYDSEGRTDTQLVDKSLGDQMGKLPVDLGMELDQFNVSSNGDRESATQWWELQFETEYLWFFHCWFSILFELH